MSCGKPALLNEIVIADGLVQAIENGGVPRELKVLVADYVVICSQVLVHDTNLRIWSLRVAFLPLLLIVFSLFKISKVVPA